MREMRETITHGLPVWYKGVQGVKFRELAIKRFSFHLFCSFSLEQLQRIAINAKDVYYIVILENYSQE